MEREVEGWAYFRFPEQAVVQLYFLCLTYMPWQSQTILHRPRIWWGWVSSAFPEIVPSASWAQALPQPHPLRIVSQCWALPHPWMSLSLLFCFQGPLGQ